jgi:hypothetical protein
MVLAVLVGITAWWSSYYGNHQLASVAVRYLHLAGLLLGGGTALFADRQVLRVMRAGSQEQEAVLAELSRAHRYVVSCIVVVATAGILMTASDTATFLVSKLYWTKMLLVGLLVTNGAVLLLSERRARRIGVAAGWLRLAAVSTVSAMLWLTILFLGILLTVAA